jgi:hypothetical protein
LKSSGYSGTPLAKKLGIKPGFNIEIINAPAHYYDLFTDMPETVSQPKSKKDFIHFFTKEIKELEKNILKLKNSIVPNGIIWISWPKKASKVPTDVTEDLIRNIAIKNGLVDIKVCTVDDIWSGLKLVIPVKDR